MNKLLLATLWLTVFAVACRKDLPAPDVRFTGKDNGNGIILFEVKSLNALTYQWYFGDSSAVSTVKNPSHAYKENGEYLVKLEATGPWGKTTVSNPVTVTGVRGSVMFWMAEGKSSVEVFVEDVKVGTIYNFFPKGVVYCGTNGCAQANNLTEGEHAYTAREQGTNDIKWTGKVSVVGGQCGKVKLAN